MLHRWIISSVQIQMKKQNCEDWLVRITFMETLKHVGSIVIKNADFHFAKYFMNILSQYPSWIHPGKFSGENPLCKITPRRKTFGFFTSPTIKCITYFTPGKNTRTLIIPSEFLDFTQWDLILPLWYYRYSLVCGNISLESRQCKVTLPPEI